MTKRKDVTNQVSVKYSEGNSVFGEVCNISSYRIYSINRPGHLLNFHHFQQLKYIYFATKQ